MKKGGAPRRLGGCLLLVNSVVWGFGAFAGLLIGLFGGPFGRAAGSVQGLSYTVAVLAVGGGISLVSLLFGLKLMGRGETAAKTPPRPQAASPKAAAPQSTAQPQPHDDFFNRLALADAAIGDRALSADIGELARLARGIFDNRALNTSDSRAFESFESCYLPTTLRLLESCADTLRRRPGPELAERVRADAREGAKLMIKSFSRVYDSLFEPTALDLSAELSVLEGVLARDGLLTDGQPDNRPSSDSSR